MTISYDIATYQCDAEYERYGNNDYIPIRWNVTFHSMPEGEPRLRKACAYTVTSYAINSAVDDAEFVLEFPPGTMVSDRRSRQTYILKPEGEKRLVTRGEIDRGAKYSDLMATNSGQARLPGADTSGRWWWALGLCATAVCLLALAGAILFIRSRRAA